MPKPGERDAWGYTIKVNQVDFGHVARKPTWLYIVGTPLEALSFPPPGIPTHWVSGFRSTQPSSVKKKRHREAPPWIKFCSAEQRRRTPPAFAEWLVDVALKSCRAAARDAW